MPLPSPIVASLSGGDRMAFSGLIKVRERPWQKKRGKRKNKHRGGKPGERQKTNRENHRGNEQTQRGHNIGEQNEHGEK